ncbi:MAG: hypothetical protein QN158_13020, partial [Armatimonadota bacterium]|nr:hypothetical protein [Armatimonadota bacterium]
MAERPVWFLLLLALWTAAAFLFGAYDLRRASQVRSSVPHTAALSLAVAALYLAVPLVTPALHTSRLTAASFILATVGLVGVGRTAYALLVAQPVFRQRAVIVGAGWAGRALVDAIRERADSEYELVGFIDDDPAKQGSPVAGLPVLGTWEALAEAVRMYRINEVIVAITRYEAISGELLQALVACREQGVQVIAMASLYERLTGRVPVEHAGRGLHVVFPVHRELSLSYQVLKRATDFTIGLLGAAIVALLLPVVGLAIWLDDRGPVFYRQTRLGRGG